MNGSNKHIFYIFFFPFSFVFRLTSLVLNQHIDNICLIAPWNCHKALSESRMFGVACRHMKWRW